LAGARVALLVGGENIAERLFCILWFQIRHEAQNITRAATPLPAPGERS
jgi:hypothetical protein